MPGSLKEILTVIGGVCAIAMSILGIRARKSADDTRIAKNTAEAGIYSQALASVTTERNGWRDAYRASEDARRDLQALNAGLMARQEAHDQMQMEMRTRHLAELKDRQRQISLLRGMVGRSADPETLRVLGSEWARTDPGTFDMIEGDKKS